MGAARDVLRDADVVHCHVGAPTGAAIAPLLPSAARLVVTEHASYLPRVFRDPLGAELYGMLRQRADAFTAVSAQTASLIDTAIPVPAHRQPVSVIANPVDMRRLPLRAERTARIARWLFVGNLVEAKGVRRLVRSFARWASAHADRPCVLTLAGDGPLRGELAQLAAELGVGDRVHFLGRVEPDAVGEVYRGHDVLVHLSHGETFGLTCVEAAASGLSVVVTTCGAPESTLLAHRAVGLAAFVPVADEDDVESVCDAVDGLDAPVENGLRELSRRQLSNQYGAEAIGDALHAVLIGGSTTPRVRPGIRLLAVAQTPAQRRACETALATAASLGGGGVYVTFGPAGRVLPQAVRVIDLTAPGAWMAPAPDGRNGRRAALRLGTGATLGRAEAALVSGSFFAFFGRWGERVWRRWAPRYVARKLAGSGFFADGGAAVNSALRLGAMADPFIEGAATATPDIDVRGAWTAVDIARRHVRLLDRRHERLRRQGARTRTDAGRRR